MKIYQSPFFILGATIRDHRRRILELAEDRQLELESEICQKARSDLTNPRARLAAEIAWLPGLSPRKAAQMMGLLRQSPLEIRTVLGLPKLAHLNLIAATFAEVSSQIQGGDDFFLFIQDIAYLVEAIHPEDLLIEINEDREISGFPEIRSVELVEAEWVERKRYYLRVILDVLDRLPSLTLIQVVRKLVADMTTDGSKHGPGLIHDLVDSYEVEVSGAMGKDAENIRALIKVVRENAESSESRVEIHIKNMEYVARHWVSIAKPIQLSMKARGISHDASRSLAYEIRSLGIDLYNDHGMLVQAQRIIDFLLSEFEEVVGLSEQLRKDKADLEKIGTGSRKVGSRGRAEASDINYSVDIGWFFKKRLSISREGISWNGVNYCLESIRSIRWGAEISQWSKYTIALGDEGSEALIELSDPVIYYAFIKKLWRAVSGRIIVETLNELKAGRAVRFGRVIVTDEGINLTRALLFLESNPELFTWSNIQIRGDNGTFYITGKDDRRFRAGLSYLNDSNTHILECILQLALKRPNLRKLSELLS